MKKKYFLLLGLLGLAVLLVPVTAFASGSAKQAKAHSPHVLHQKSYYQHRNQNQSDNPLGAASATSNPFSSVNLTYHGGPVMTGTTNIFAIYWEPGNNVSANYNSLISRYFGDVGASPLYKIANQYTQNGGGFPSNAVLAASWVDTNAYPESPLLDNDIENEVTHAQQVNGWQAADDNIFFVFTGRNEDLCFDSSLSECASNTFCAYHSYFGTNTIYAAMPYAASFLCNPEAPGGVTPNSDDADLTINVTSHEQIEAATDPLLNAWYDDTIFNDEIGDKCAWTFGPLDSTGGDVKWNGNHYLVQQEWNNALSGCTLSPRPASQFYEVKNLKSGLVMDVSGGSTASGAQIVQSSDHNSYSQRWSLVSAGNGYQLMNRNSGLVLTVSGASKSVGANLIQSSNHYGDSQRWIIIPENGYALLMDMRSVLFARPTGGSTATGAHIVQDKFVFGSTSEQWALVPVYYVIQNVKSGMVMDISGGSTSAGASVVQEPASGSDSQSWALIPDGSTYQLWNRKSHLFLSILNASTTAGASMVQQTNHNGLSQQWTFLSGTSSCRNGNICQIKSAKDGFVLDLSGDGTAQGAKVIQTANQNASSQEWVLVPLV